MMIGELDFAALGAVFGWRQVDAVQFGVVEFWVGAVTGKDVDVGPQQVVGITLLPSPISPIYRHALVPE
jgi:hypothetical protein